MREMSQCKGVSVCIFYKVLVCVPVCVLPIISATSPGSHGLTLTLTVSLLGWILSTLQKINSSCMCEATEKLAAGRWCT